MSDDKSDDANANANVTHGLHITWNGEGGALLDEILSARSPYPTFVPVGDEGLAPAPAPTGTPARPASTRTREPTRAEWEAAGWSPPVPGAPPPNYTAFQQMMNLPRETPADAPPASPNPDGTPGADRSKAEQKERLARIQKRDGGIIILALDLGELSTVSVSNRVIDPLLAVTINVNVKDKERMAAHLRNLANRIEL